MESKKKSEIIASKIEEIRDIKNSVKKMTEEEFLKSKVILEPKERGEKLFNEGSPEELEKIGAVNTEKYLDKVNLRRRGETEKDRLEEDSSGDYGEMSDTAFGHLNKGIGAGAATVATLSIMNGNLKRRDIALLVISGYNIGAKGQNRDNSLTEEISQSLQNIEIKASREAARKLEEPYRPGLWIRAWNTGIVSASFLVGGLISQIAETGSMGEVNPSIAEGGSKAVVEMIKVMIKKGSVSIMRHAIKTAMMENDGSSDADNGDGGAGLF